MIVKLLLPAFYSSSLLFLLCGSFLNIGYENITFIVYHYYVLWNLCQLIPLRLDASFNGLPVLLGEILNTLIRQIVWYFIHRKILICFADCCIYRFTFYWIMLNCIEQVEINFFFLQILQLFFFSCIANLECVVGSWFPTLYFNNMKT